MAASIVFGQLKPTGSIGGPRSVQTAPRGLVAEPAGRPLGVLSQGTQVERSDSFPMIPLHSNPTPEGTSNQKVSTYIECLGSLRDITEDDKEILSLLANSRPQELSSCLNRFFDRCADMIIQDIKGYDGKRMTVYSNLGNNFLCFCHCRENGVGDLGVEDESSLMDNGKSCACAAGRSRKIA